MVDILAAPDTADDLRLFPQPVVRDHHRDVPAYRLICPIAEQAFRACVPGHDGAVEIFADDGVVRRFDYGDELAGCTFRPLTGIFEAHSVQRKTELSSHG